MSDSTDPDDESRSGPPQSGSYFRLSLHRLRLHRLHLHRLQQLAPIDRYAALSLVVALFAGGLAVWIGANLFPHLSANHDEAVYLQQAAMLLEGQLRLRPPPSVVGDVRPWFFVRDGNTLYAKYAPVVPAIWSLGIAAGWARLAVGAVAALTVWTTSRLGASLFDERVGFAAAVALVVSPMFLLTGSTFLAYAPTTLLNVVFAYAYVRAERHDSLGWGLAAGLAIGLAFFARPYTAVLFATPFLVHALWRLRRASIQTPGRRRRIAIRLSATAVPGLTLVGVSLWYNAVLTGDPLVFPYEAFAPRDGLGFGRRRMLDHALDYTPWLAVRSNVAVLFALAARWGPAGALGTVLAASALASWARSGVRDPLQAALAATILSVIVGNLFFWGNRNILGSLALPNDGFIAQLGPFYHFDLLVPLSVFAGLGAVRTALLVRAAAESHPIPGEPNTRTLSVAFATALLLLAGYAGAAAVDDPVARNERYTDRYERAYGAFEGRSFDHALVFVPTPQGPWLNHPFQDLRNQPGFDGPAVYVQAPDDARDAFDAVDAFPDRSLVRYTYKGRFDDDPLDPMVPALQDLRVVSGGSVSGTTSLGVPDRVSVLRASVTVGGRTESLSLPNASTFDGLEWRVEPHRVTVEPAGGGQPVSLEYAGPTTVSFSVTMVDHEGNSITYAWDVLIRQRGGTVDVMAPPETRVCRLVTDCGLEGTYLRDHPGRYPSGVAVAHNVTATA